ncbi:MAG: arginyltransferase [Robiginitomaculum sp.]|nr:arginyltransferase [Robiginitomaculum sp.]MDQ7078265.1 arginyltransferase [Robiginitomaculum sp.]
MTHPFPLKQLRFFLTAPAPCPYLPGKMERKLFTHLHVLDGPELNDSLTQAGFRRSQNIVYRPACENCSACRSVRVLAAQFKPNRTQRRVFKKNADLTRTIEAALASEEHYALLLRYVRARHPDGGMEDMSYADYLSMVEDTAARSQVCEYRDESGKLLAAALVDQLSDGPSLVYSFYDPGSISRSLGTYIILDHIDQAQKNNLPYVYLGFWIQNSDKMRYKAQYRPLEVLRPHGWEILEKSE